MGVGFQKTTLPYPSLYEGGESTDIISGMRILRIGAGFLIHKLRAFFHPKASLLREKEAAPDFDLSDDQGKRHRLKDYLGKKVVLWFFLRANTPG